MAAYTYRPLDFNGSSFRLLKLLQGNLRDDIHCEIIYGSIEESIPYDALSYRWGNKRKAATITVDGITMGVTLNAYKALQQIRSKDGSRYLWIDAICIDQDNTQEKGHQVQQMGRIYQNAEQVVIWLGQGTKETDLIMDSMKPLHELFVKKEGSWRELARFWVKSFPAGCYEGMKFLLSRRWFRRIWILQEVANARVATVLCGNKSISALVFVQVPRLLGLRPDPHCQAVLDIMPGPLRQTSWWKDNRDLYTLLKKFGNSEATDKRDIVYALLGISSDAYKKLLPDYEKPLLHVISDTTSFL
ncbi:heterokaryon incompatibility protein-domain-containing protein, partial [Bisporella sp. PMI_857]